MHTFGESQGRAALRARALLSGGRTTSAIADRINQRPRCASSCWSCAPTAKSWGARGRVLTKHPRGHLGGGRGGPSGGGAFLCTLGVGGGAVPFPQAERDAALSALVGLCSASN